MKKGLIYVIGLLFSVEAMSADSVEDRLSRIEDRLMRIEALITSSSIEEKELLELYTRLINRQLDAIEKDVSDIEGRPRQISQKHYPHKLPLNVQYPCLKVSVRKTNLSHNTTQF
jgi:hypothetical protein